MTKKNRWWLTLIYCLCGLLIISTVVCCVVNVNYKPQIQTPYVINVQDNNYAKYTVGSSQTGGRYNEMLDAFNNSFSENVLTSIFSGRAGFDSRIIESTSKDPMASFTGFKVRFTCEESEIMLNGKPYNPPTNTSKTLKYTDIIFNVTENDSMQKHYIYYAVIDDVTSKTVYYQQTVMCDFSGLYDLLISY